MGRKKAWDANDGTCVLLVRLLALCGLLVFDMEPPGPPKAPPLLQPPEVADVPEKGVPRREGAALVEDGDMEEGGRSGSSALFVEDCVVARPSG